jgi:hypothetical protein
LTFIECAIAISGTSPRFPIRIRKSEVSRTRSTTVTISPTFPERELALSPQFRSYQAWLEAFGRCDRRCIPLTKKLQRQTKPWPGIKQGAAEYPPS